MRPVSAAKRNAHDPCRIKLARAPTTVATVARAQSRVLGLAGHGYSAHHARACWPSLASLSGRLANDPAPGALPTRRLAKTFELEGHQFVTHMATWRAMPSSKQQEWLNAIAERFGGSRHEGASHGSAPHCPPAGWGGCRPRPDPLPRSRAHSPRPLALGHLRRRRRADRP
jgi:hypothetical protein